MCRGIAGEGDFIGYCDAIDESGGCASDARAADCNRPSRPDAQFIERLCLTRIGEHPAAVRHQQSVEKNIEIGSYGKSGMRGEIDEDKGIPGDGGEIRRQSILAVRSENQFAGERIHADLAARRGLQGCGVDLQDLVLCAHVDAAVRPRCNRGGGSQSS